MQPMSTRLTRIYLYLFAFIFVLSSWNIQTVKSDVILLIDLWNYTNPSSSLHTGQCCDSNLFLSDCTLLNTRCTVRLKICIDSADRMEDIANPDSCYYASTVLNGQRDINTFNFKTNPQAKQPFIFSLAWNQLGNPRFLLKFFAIDDSSVGELVARRATEKLIDYYAVNYNEDENIFPSPGLANELNWVRFPVIKGGNSRDSFQTYLTLSVAMKCSTNYYTPSCNVRCVQQDSCHRGHYKCHPHTGEKICNPGFIDPSTNCVLRDPSIQLCESSDADFCGNNGNCYQNLVQLINVTFPTCCCNQGFGGADCSDILVCDMNSCQNNGVCSMNMTTNLGYCTCKLGYVGKYCEKKITCPQDYYGEDCSIFCQATDTCASHQACDFYGRLKCKDGWGSFPACNIRLIDQMLDPECPAVTNDTNVPCLNGGSCYRGACCCPMGFTGDRCETIADLCLTNPCENGARCQSNEAGFICNCLSGYSGDLCEVFTDPCQSTNSRCSDAGLCVPFPDFSGFSCSCNNGYTGEFCETQIDNCQSRPCLNNATCITFLNEYFCSCPAGFTGLNCENQVNHCSSQPCIHGSCNLLVNDYVCSCDPGWTNHKTCNDDIDECLFTNPPSCQNNATCVNTIGSFRCECPEGYEGFNCQNKIDFCSFNTCVSNGISGCENDYLENTFRCKCLAGYSGKNCEIDVDECSSQPCMNGQCVDLLNGYKCENCTELGFTGPQCDIPIDYCSPMQCVENQYDNCVNYQTTYKCLCKPGFTGINCETNIDECASDPCLNGSPCIDQINGYECLCQDGFSGDICAGAINPCLVDPLSNVTHCGEHGVCFPQADDRNYFCKCSEGYEGRNCEVQSSMCEIYKPCLNGALCIDTENHFTCACSPEYTGASCETLIDPCSSVSCYRGTCVQAPTSPSNFTCLCNEGYTGELCETVIDTCNPSQCVQNQGTCQQTFLSTGIPSFQCVCLPGYSGALCEIVIDQCEDSPCQNGGNCRSLIGFYECLCPPHYRGLNCEIFEKCSTSPCSVEGTSQCVDVISETKSDFTCQCRLGFTGKLCETNIDECSSSPCQNNGECVDLINSFACKCSGFYIGALCNEHFDFCAHHPCASNSTCTNMETNFKCLCPPDMTGSLCDQKIDSCASLPCKNGGLCINEVTDFQCVCLIGFTGKSCDIVIDFCKNPKPCQNSSCFNSCQNNASCVSTTEGISCTCMPGYTGAYCENRIDYCKLGIPCLNGGTCNPTLNGFQCLCANGFTGSRCDSVFDNCQSDTCQNNGLCRTAQNGTVYCTCEPGFNGAFCENSIDMCKNFPCENGGSCTNMLGTYQCNCPINYSGNNCEIKVNFCASMPCRNNGQCLDGASGFTCSCLSGFSGEICQIKLQACDSTPCSHGTCINTEGGYRCSCFTGFTGAQCQTQIDWCGAGTEINPICFNNGTCVNTLDNFSCRCVNGFSGDRCEVLTDPCASQPCVRGNCSLIASGYQCKCPIGFTGTNCEIDIDECAQMTHTCYNNSTCINVIGDYACQCLSGYTGRKCELAIDNCFGRPCKNDGLCSNLPGGLIQCLCLPGYTGQFCELVNDPCQSQPCKGTAVCTTLSPTKFQCECPPGLTGTLCEQNVNPCSLHVCLNNSTCINLATPVCACLPGYSGDQCEVYTNPCQSQVRCANGGRCNVVGNMYTCSCLPGFTGLNCEIVNSCLSSPCQNGGACSSSTTNGYQCLCEHGFTGSNCEIAISACEPNPCLNQGTCSVGYNGEFTCICLPGITGARCQTNLTECSNTCKFGECVNQNCVCVAGYMGVNCDIDINECNPNPCFNGGTCSQPFINMYSCSCPSGFTGQNCDLRPQICDTRPCQNGGQCQPVGDSYVCNCLPGTTGSNCETQINECSSNPCQNGALCIDGYNQYSCSCLVGFQGVHCEIDVNECLSNPCNPNAICTTPQVNMYQCTCKQGYSGLNCDIVTNVCDSNPCYNAGLCSTTVQNSFVCICTPGYTGTLCQNRLDECHQGNCNTNFTNQQLNIYQEQEQVNFESYRNCIINTWIVANPMLSSAVTNNIALTQQAIKPSIEFTNSLYGNHTTTIVYSISIMSSISTNLIKVPTMAQFNAQCSNVVFNPVTTYENYWDVYLCGFYSASDIEDVRRALLATWKQKYPDIKASCDCLNVDIFPSKIAHTSPDGEQTVTRFQYLVYAGLYNLLIEKGKVMDVNKFPSNSEIESGLQQNQFKSCRGLIVKPVIFSVTKCGPVKIEYYTVIANQLAQAWRNELALSGGFGNNNVWVQVQGQQEYLSDDTNGQATLIKYVVYVNNQQIDTDSLLSYDHDRVVEAFASNNKLCKPNYAISKAFNILTTNKVCDYSHSNINAALSQINLPGMASTSHVRALFISYGVEEYIDDHARTYYSLPVFVIVDNQFLDPATNLPIYNAILQTIGNIIANPPYQKFSVYNFYGNTYYRVSVGFKFYFNHILPEQSLNLVSNYIGQSFESINLNATRSHISIKRQKDVILQNQSRNARNINQLLVFISDKFQTKLYDSRQESIFQITRKLKSLINALSTPIISGTETIALLDNIDENNLIDYKDLFVLYVKNSYMEISPADMIKISSWLNNHWHSFSNNSQAIGIINSQLYFDNGNLLIGINYMVSNQNPQCGDFTYLKNLLKDSFESNLIGDLCNCEFSYVTHYGPRPTRSFYTLDLIGDFNAQETVFNEKIRNGLLNAWSKEYSGFSNISKPTISNQFYKRIGRLGTLISRVYYTINVENQQVIRNYRPSPSIKSIESEFNLLGVDYRIYPSCSSLDKSLFSSLYVKAYPLRSDDRKMIEMNIRTALTHLNYINPAIQNEIVVTYSQLYQAQTFGYNVSRVYYALYINNNLVYPCELINLYATSVTAIPTSISFDYMIRSRYLDLSLPNSNKIVHVSDLLRCIRNSWHAYQAGTQLNVTQIEVNIGDIQYYTSKFKPVIQRVYYFLTIRNKNVNDENAASESYREPTLSFFKKRIKPIADVDFFMPLRAFRIYLRGNTDSINLGILQANLTSRFVHANPQFLFANLLSTKPCQGESTIVRINALMNPNQLNFYNSLNSSYSNVSRIIYSGLYDSYADHQNLFTRLPTEADMVYQQNDLNETIPSCNVGQCIPALFYDFYTDSRITLEDTKNLVFGTRNAWFLQNNKENDLDFQNMLDIKMYSVIPFCSVNSSRIVYRVFYSAGLKENSIKLDITDFIDPTDVQYNASLHDRLQVIDRTAYTEDMIACSYRSAYADDKVEGIKWWMILIIALAAILALVFLILCIFCIKTRRGSSPPVAKSDSVFNLLHNKNETFRSSDLNATVNSQQAPRKSSFKLSTTSRKSKKSMQQQKPGLIYSFRSKNNNNSEIYKTPEARLNQPQQYEAKIN